MRDSVLNTAEIRWEVLKSMLDDFPQLLDRTERYILDKRSRACEGSADNASPDATELIQKAVSAYREERARK